MPPALPRRALGKTGLGVSSLGFGCYRVDDRTPFHAEALRRALLGGVNLIDTSTNYGDGGSERLVGKVVAALVDEGPVRREDLVVVSKIGYVQGENLGQARARAAAGRPWPELVEYMDQCWHCVHPQFLADQLDRSLDRLGLRRLDVCLLHNPEYFFSDAARRRRADADRLPALRDEFYRRLQQSFAFFETQVARGRIGAYGVSSNTVAADPDDPETTSFERMLAAAEAAAGGAGHHFQVLQLPLNLLEPEGAIDRHTGGRTVLEAAAARGVGVLVNRPLNAIRGNQVVRLAGALGPALAPLIDPALPTERHAAPLSQKALHVLTSTPGVTCVLLGMRRPPYVDDALPVMSWPPLPPEAPAQIYQTLRAGLAHAAQD